MVTVTKSTIGRGDSLKLFGSALVVTMLLVGSAAQGTPFSLTLQALHATVELGSPVLLELTTTNNLTRPLKLGKTNPGSEYQMDVRDKQGHAVPQTALYEQLQNPEFVFRSTTQTLKPQESAKEEFNIAEFFDFANPGIYSVQIKRLVPRQYGAGVVNSNTIQLTITPQH